MGWICCGIGVCPYGHLSYITPTIAFLASLSFAISAFGCFLMIREDTSPTGRDESFYLGYWARGNSSPDNQCQSWYNIDDDVDIEKDEYWNSGRVLGPIGLGFCISTLLVDASLLVLPQATCWLSLFLIMHFVCAGMSAMLVITAKYLSDTCIVDCRLGPGAGVGLVAMLLWLLTGLLVAWIRSVEISLGGGGYRQRPALQSSTKPDSYRFPTGDAPFPEEIYDPEADFCAEERDDYVPQMLTLSPMKEEDVNDEITLVMPTSHPGGVPFTILANKSIDVPNDDQSLLTSPHFSESEKDKKNISSSSGLSNTTPTTTPTGKSSSSRSKPQSSFSTSRSSGRSHSSKKPRSKTESDPSKRKPTSNDRAGRRKEKENKDNGTPEPSSPASSTPKRDSKSSRSTSRSRSKSSSSRDRNKSPRKSYKKPPQPDASGIPGSPHSINKSPRSSFKSHSSRKSPRKSSKSMDNHPESPYSSSRPPSAPRISRSNSTRSRSHPKRLSSNSRSYSAASMASTRPRTVKEITEDYDDDGFLHRTTIIETHHPDGTVDVERKLQRVPPKQLKALKKRKLIRYKSQSDMKEEVRKDGSVDENEESSKSALTNGEKSSESEALNDGDK